MQRKRKPKNEDILAALFEKRLIVLMESDDGATFEQVVLNQEQFKKVSDAIGTVVDDPETQQNLPEGAEVCNVVINDEVHIPANLFLGLSSIGEEELE